MKEIGLFLLVIALWTSAQVLLKWGLAGFAGQKVDFPLLYPRPELLAGAGRDTPLGRGRSSLARRPLPLSS